MISILTNFHLQISQEGSLLRVLWSAVQYNTVCKDLKVNLLFEVKVKYVIPYLLLSQVKTLFTSI